MRTVRLYGVLAEKFGREFRLDVKNPAEAVRALCSQIKGLRQHFEKFSEPGYIVRVGKESRGVEELTHPCSSKEVIRIIPATAGATATVRIIIGVILIIGSFFGGGPYMFMAGMTLVMGGVAELLAPSPPKMKPNRAANATPSYMFDGPVNTIGSGYAMSVGYGEMLIGSHVVSAEFYSVEEALNPLTAGATVQENQSSVGSIING